MRAKRGASSLYVEVFVTLMEVEVNDGFGWRNLLPELCSMRYVRELKLLGRCWMLAVKFRRCPRKLAVLKEQ